MFYIAPSGPLWHLQASRSAVLAQDFTTIPKGWIMLKRCNEDQFVLVKNASDSAVSAETLDSPEKEQM